MQDRHRSSYEWDEGDPVIDIDDYDTIMAKQRASISWIVQKAHKNKVPSEMEEPFYKDYEGQERLKPGIVHRLSNADLYCSALANIYGDPNFHNLSHWNIIQALARKGVYVAEPTDVALTETVLIQTTPIKISAHLAVIEAMISLYIREVVIAERVVQAIQRVSGVSQSQEVPAPQDHEDALVLWVDNITQAFQARLQQQVRPPEGQELPVFPKIQDLSDLSDGIGLAALIAYYCPQELSWEDIAVADPPSMADSLYNVGLVIKFCHESLPYNPCLLSKEDIVYMHSSVKQNILAFVAELFFLTELEPVSCVSSRKSSKYIQLSSPGIKSAGIPSAPSVRRSHSMTLNDVQDANRRSDRAPSSQNSEYGGRDSSISDGQESEFMVQRAKGYSTLNDMMRTQSSPRPSHVSSQDHGGHRYTPKEKFNVDSKEEEMGERNLMRRGSFYGSNQDLGQVPAAGIPSRLEKRPSGRSRSRRNSITAEDSQLTIENFGGSQDNLNYISRNPDKEPYVHSGKLQNPASNGRRSVSQSRERDFERSDWDELDNRVVDKLERDALEREKSDRKYSRDSSKERGTRRDPDTTSSESDTSYDADRRSTKPTSFAELSKIKDQLPGGINIIYMQSDRDDQKAHGKEKKASFAALPNQTTWKQQTVQNHCDDTSDFNDEMESREGVSAELYNVKLKLEEKRRRIEAEKRKMELAANKQRQKMGKDAFMQAVVKDLGTEVSNVSKKWLQDRGPVEELKTPDMESMDPEDYHRSLNQMTDSLTEIQSDIQRLTHQQHQIHSMMHNGSPGQPHHANFSPQQQNQFYLHEQGSPSRRMWNQQGPPHPDGYSSISPASRRAQWGPVRPMLPQPNEYVMGGPPQQSGYYSYQVMQPAMQLPPMNHVGHAPAAPHPQGFLLHGQAQSLPPGHQQTVYQNGQSYYAGDQFRGYPNSSYDRVPQTAPNQTANAPFRLHAEADDLRRNSSLHSSAPSQSQQPQPPPRHQKSPSPSRQFSHAPVTAPPPDDMEPQNVSFIESDENSEKFKRLSISSGSKTYRIPREPGSPTRTGLPSIGSGTKTYRVPTKKGSHVYDAADLPEPSPPPRSRSPRHSVHDASSPVRVEPLAEGRKSEQGFYISLEDDSAPKRPKPPLRTKKMAQKKNSAPSTPQSTPTSESAPPLPVLNRRQSSLSNLSATSGSSTYSPKNHFAATPYKRVTSPPYATPQVPYASPDSSCGSPTSYWTPRSVHHHDKENNSSFNNNGDTYNPRSSRKDDNSSFSNSNIGDTFNPRRGRYYAANSYGRDDSTPESDASTGSDFASERHGGKSSAVGSSNRPLRRESAAAASSTSLAMIIGDEHDPPNSALSEMEKKKERLMMMSMRRKQQQEEAKRKKEIEAELKREEEKVKEDMKLRKKEEEKARRELILERHKIKKAIEDAEKEGRHFNPPAWYYEDSGAATPSGRSSSVKARNRSAGGPRPRPKTMHEASFASGPGPQGHIGAVGKAGSSHNLATANRAANATLRKNRWGSSGSLARSSGNRGSTGSIVSDYPAASMSRTLGRHSGRRPVSVVESGDTTAMRRARSRGSRSNESESLMYHMSEDSGLGPVTPPRRAPSPGMSSRHLTSPMGPGSLPPFLFARRKPALFDDNMSDISTTSSNMDYCGPRLFKQPTAKSNRNIILNAVEYCVFPGAVNQSSKQRVLEEIARAETKYFLILFRDSGCQFRALYAYNPDTEDVYKLYGTGPKQVTERMFEKFFKYNSGGKCFAQVHTKSLTVTIDAFTIHNSLWQGKRVNLPSKKDMKLVI